MAVEAAIRGTLFVMYFLDILCNVYIAHGVHRLNDCLRIQTLPHLIHILKPLYPDYLDCRQDPVYQFLLLLFPEALIPKPC